MEVMGKLLRHEDAEPRRLPAELVVRSSTAEPRPTPASTSNANLPNAPVDPFRRTESLLQ
jgi:hypothetical protein